MPICPNCGSEASSSANFCERCGASFATPLHKTKASGSRVGILILLMFVCMGCGLLVAVPASKKAEPTPTFTSEQSVIHLVRHHQTDTGYLLYFNIETFDLNRQTWSAEPRGMDWVVSLCWLYKGERSCGSWLYRPDVNQVSPLDYWGRFFFYNEAGF